MRKDEKPKTFRIEDFLSRITKNKVKADDTVLKDAYIASSDNYIELYDQRNDNMMNPIEQKSNNEDADSHDKNYTCKGSLLSNPFFGSERTKSVTTVDQSVFSQTNTKGKRNSLAESNNETLSPYMTQKSCNDSNKKRYSKLSNIKQTPEEILQNLWKQRGKEGLNLKDRSQSLVGVSRRSTVTMKEVEMIEMGDKKRCQCIKTPLNCDCVIV